MFRKLISLLLIASMLFSITVLSGCDAIRTKTVKKTHLENDNEDISGWDDLDDPNVVTWDNADIQTFEDVDIYAEWAYSTLLFDNCSEEFPVVDAVVLDYKANGKYFDGETLYELVNADFDINSIIAEHAVGTGVIVVCVVLYVTVAGLGAPQPVVCFFAGAANSSISYAVKGQALGMAIGAVTSAIQSDGDWESVLYGSLEAGAEGYMWGAIWGAATGGFTSEYCFTEDTLVQTEMGLRPINEIKANDLVLSYDEINETYTYERVEYISTNETYKLLNITTSSDLIEVTEGHPFLTNRGWIEAKDLIIGDQLITADGTTYVIDISVETFDVPLTTYNFSVENTHTYLVGQENIVVHNSCNACDETRYFEEGTVQAEKYPDGVYFDSNGYPRFEPYIAGIPGVTDSAIATFEIGELTGVYAHDARLANQFFGLSETPAGFVWHHVEDGRTLILLPQDLHSVRFGGMAHNGGASVIRTTLAAGTNIAA